MMKWLNSPKFWRNFNGVCTVIWTLLIIPTVLWWTDSIVWVVFMSLWANIASHLAGYVAGRTEVKEDKREENGDDGTEPEPSTTSLPC
jgi:multisubunit Na+/H+ antiporter MnhG subunit